eukprot:gene424-536_t
MISTTADTKQQQYILLQQKQKLQQQLHLDSNQEKQQQQPHIDFNQHQQELIENKKKLETLNKERNRVPDPDFYYGLYAHFKTVSFFHNATKYSKYPYLNTEDNDYDDEIDYFSGGGRRKENVKVSIVTQTTVDRLNKISWMAEKWRGPLSTAVFIKNPDTDIERLKTIIQMNPSLRQFSDFHLLYANKTRYPVNNLRNLAIKNARTDFVFLMDADFIPPFGLHDYISNYINLYSNNNNNFVNINNNNNYLFKSNNNNNNKKKNSNPSSSILIKKQQQQQPQPKQMLVDDDNNYFYNRDDEKSDENIEEIDQQQQQNNDKFSFVIPSFSSSEDPSILPDDKPTLIKMVKEGRILPSNIDECFKCHSPTNFTFWYSTNQPFEAEYRWIYEPYLVYNKSMNEPFDERLKGYGFDKNSHTFQMAVQGYKFIVLPHAFIIHINHPASSWEGPSHRDQQWDSLRIVCDIIPSAKRKNNIDPNYKIFDEPIGDECLSDSHW